jgi:hypothetical protein
MAAAVVVADASRAGKQTGGVTVACRPMNP